MMKIATYSGLSPRLSFSLLRNIEELQFVVTFYLELFSNAPRFVVIIGTPLYSVRFPLPHISPLSSAPQLHLYLKE